MNTQTVAIEPQASNTITQMVTLGLYGVGIGAGALFGVAAILLVA
ncbi:hypothetical protein V5T82_09225 [Magnetovibrio sp. PR-2]